MGTKLGSYRGGKGLWWVRLTGVQGTPRDQEKLHRRARAGRSWEGRLSIYRDSVTIVKVWIQRSLSTRPSIYWGSQGRCGCEGPV